ncbi:MAG: hypothetical protein H6766_04910 [Candidatus Peribacteria bacterium]|nr:MAG: hypothetical protein H6766_04910 [Candidatus Peribacteria bacterium]
MKKWLDEHMKTLDDKETEQDLWNLLKEKPHFKLYYKDFFGKYGEEIHTILDKGPAYAQWIAERWKHDKEAQNTEEAEAA